MRILKRLLLALGLMTAVLGSQVMAANPGQSHEALPGAKQIHEAIQHVLNSNAQFAATHPASYFKPFLEGQTPIVTAVTCADSRIHTHAFDQCPDNDVFMVRNIGNQLFTSEGSIEYGVHHLHTPLLLFIGHSACGAIKAALGDYSKEPASIKRELDTIRVTKGDDATHAMIANINHQVAAALKKFRPEVQAGHLAVMGVVYDFRDDLKQGRGKLTIVNLNGETDTAKIKQSPLLQGIKDVSVGAQLP
jgi:carbonic anhydrase